MRSTANPRRITLTHLTDVDEFTPRAHPGQEGEIELPASTANPERTVLMEAPLVG